METLEKQEVELSEQGAHDFSVDAEITATVDAGSLHSSLTELADSFDVSGFKCVKCGLVHMHDSTKHRLSDSFDIGESESANLEYNPVCHCGVQEAGRHGNDFGIDESKAASIARNAPIPPESSREMDETLGTL